MQHYAGATARRQHVAWAQAGRIAKCAQKALRLLGARWRCVRY